MSVAQGFFLVALVVALVAALWDARTGHIPNWLTLGTLALAPVVQALVGASPTLLGWSLLGAVLCAFLPWLLFRAGGMGGGDVKLFGAVGSLLMPMASLHAVTYAFVAGAAWAVVLLARQRRLLPAFGNAARLFTVRLGARTESTPSTLTELRFGPAIFVGTFAAVLSCWSGA